jgi:hypothetical protein
VVAFGTLVILHLLPFLMSGRVAPPRAVHKQIFRESLDVDDLLPVLDVKGVEVTPKGLFFEALL